MNNILSIIGRAIRYLIYAITIFTIVFTAYVLINYQETDDEETWKYKLYTVLSDSMQEDFQAGDVVIIKNVDPEELEVGDIITFYSIDPLTEGEVYTHKIKEITTYQGELAFETYGTTTGDSDLYPALAENVVGELVYVLPDIGFATEFAKSKEGYVLIILIPILICIFLEIRHLIKLVKDRKAEQNPMSEERQKIADKYINEQNLYVDDEVVYFEWESSFESSREQE